MTDKVQKIRNEIEKLKSNLMYGACSSQVAMETRCKEEAYNEVLAILDSMQKEPKFKVGDTLINSDGEKRTIVEVGEDYYKFDDCSILHFKAQDKWKVVKAPKECMYSKDNYNDEDRKVLCEGCEEKCKFNKKKEPVSEDLEEAIDTYLATYFGGEKEKRDWPFLKKMAIHFANWHKQKLMMAKTAETTFNVSLPCSVYDKLKAKGCKDGDKLLIVIKED